MNISTAHSKFIYAGLVILCFMPFVSPVFGLCGGIALSFAGIKLKSAQVYTSYVLQASIVLMGFGMELTQVISASKIGFIETAVSVISVMAIGLILGKLFKVEKNITLLIASGTAICGGSAIAAISPVLNSKDYQNSFALIVVFVLNAIALIVFPYVGWQMHMSESIFGNWAAIAIHDTSSVVGASATYGTKALEIATTVKLIRALWIIPLSLVIAMFNKDVSRKAITFPWFILLFVVAILVANYFPDYASSYQHFNWLGKRGMVMALFFIGSNISLAEIKQSGIRSFVLGISLWLITATTSLLILTH